MVISDIKSNLAGPDVDHISGTHCTVNKFYTSYTVREIAICTWLILIFKIVILHFIPLLISQRIESVNQLYIHAQATRRGSADRPDHGGVRAAVLRAEPAAV